ncbi:MAG: hypothetical protein JNK27_09410 [Chitinophagaceae bacterium]|nr:hypothetical protein [Chitinophagaceae bacterium]
MTQRDNILQELRELQSKLAEHTPGNIYSAPTGYFDGLVEEVLRRIRALEAENAVDELAYLSPLLSKLSKDMPYTVPAGYFEEIETSLISSVSTGSQSAKEELETLSPLLSGLKKEMPYSVPAGYFENLGEKRASNKTKVVSLGSRKWIRFAAAAIVTGIIVTTGYFFLYGDKVSVDSDSYKWVKVNTKKVSTEKIDEFIQLTQEEKSGQGTIASVEKNQDIKELVKDIPENEIQSLLNDTELLDDTDTNIASDETLMN